MTDDITVVRRRLPKRPPPSSSTRHSPLSPLLGGPGVLPSRTPFDQQMAELERRLALGKGHPYGLSKNRFKKEVKDLARARWKLAKTGTAIH